MGIVNVLVEKGFLEEKKAINYFSGDEWDIYIEQAYNLKRGRLCIREPLLKKI